MKKEIITIYVQLLEEGTDTIRPTEAEFLGNDLYKLLPTSGYDPEDEIWEFLPGTTVRAIPSFDDEGGRLLLAIEQIK